MPLSPSPEKSEAASEAGGGVGFAFACANLLCVEFAAAGLLDDAVDLTAGLLAAAGFDDKEDEVGLLEAEPMFDFLLLFLLAFDEDAPAPLDLFLKF